MKEYMPIAVFDMSTGINSAFINGNFGSYTEKQYNKTLSQLSQQERE